MRYHIWTVGCQMNVADSQKLASGLDRLGWFEVETPQEADLVVLNTCSIRERPEQRAISKLGTLKKMRGGGKEFTIAVMGCMVGLKTDELQRRFPFVDVFARPQQFEPIMEAVGYEDTGGEFWPDTFATPAGVTAYVPVIHGCDKFCTYCIVPFRRGRERSRTIDDVHAEVEHLAARGVREVTLLGQTVEAYGHDLPDTPDLGDLFRAVHDIDGIERFRFLTSYPKDMTDVLLEAVRDLPKVSSYLHVPAQSGCNDVLKQMKRGYTVEEYLEMMDRIRDIVPGCSVSSDFIVGHPGETEESFQKSMGLVRFCRFKNSFIFKYSPRPGTKAHQLYPDDVPEEIKRRRNNEMLALQNEISEEDNAEFIGCEVEILVEGLSKFAVKSAASQRPTADSDVPTLKTQLVGRTVCDRITVFEGNPRLAGTLTNVVVEDCTPTTLIGSIVTHEYQHDTSDPLPILQ
ncbi:MAG: tRNA (N6-isopentenyl adenosine(37)-C2)-methylthiotransferase MiaB [Chloroflexi bacterium]|nr:tRNA (N6-isopentenyl adenosine(37)-C2)-methylthiotransferase MiaB [Chloroflexota bacterium]